MRVKVYGDLRAAVLEAVSRDGLVSREIGAENGLSAILAQYVHIECPEYEAARHWGAILDRHEELSRAAERPVTLYAAVADYFASQGTLLPTPYIVDAPVFRSTLQLAMVDSLTGAYNRRYMDTTLRKEYNRCERWGKSLSLCMIDIDNFKRINDTKGHPFGDQVLQRVAAMLSQTIRDEDILCRFGGEEFLVALPETDAEGAMALSSRLRAAVKQDPFLARHGVTFSGGTATYPEIKGVEELIAASDRALYQAKYSGKDCIFQAQPERRQFGRFPYSWTVSVQNEHTREELSDVTTLNVSLGGIQFACGVPYHADMPIHLVFRSEDPETPEFETRSRISWVRKTRSQFLYGARFEESPIPLMVRLQPSTQG